MPPFQDPDTYRDILDGLQVGVSVLDLQRRIVFWSDGAEQISGYTRAEVLGHGCAENVLLHCNQNSCEMCDEKCPIAGALRESQPVEAMGFVHHKAGHRVPVHTWAIPLRDKSGSIIGVIQTFDGQFAVHGPDPKRVGLKQRGWLDDVTGLPTKPIVLSYLREALATFTDAGIPFAIIQLEVSDLDEFRARYGQGAARSILQVLARTLRTAVWPTDFVGAWTEGNFFVILMGCDDDALFSVAARILRMMASATIRWWGEELSVKVTLGCAAAQTGDSIELLLQRAQNAQEGSAPTTTGRGAAAAASSGTAKD